MGFKIKHFCGISESIQLNGYALVSDEHDGAFIYTPAGEAYETLLNEIAEKMGDGYWVMGMIDPTHRDALDKLRKQEAGVLFRDDAPVAYIIINNPATDKMLEVMNEDEEEEEEFEDEEVGE